MPQIIGDFSHTEYLVVFNTIVFGLIATEYFGVWGMLIRNKATVKFSWLHFLWTVFSFMILLQNWYGVWPRTKYITYNFLYFLFSLVPLLLYYLISVTLSPSTRDRNIDLEKHFFQQARSLMILHAVYFLFTIVASFVYDDKGDLWVQNSVRAFAICLSLIGAYWYEKKWLHYLFLGLGFAGLAQFILAIPT
ncbi:MAG: hypothetical protein GY827_11565 [Cytophagales bacterium]|nr:hypothetical protein [Cytophagales bacterium]